MEPEQLPENKGGRPPPEADSLLQQSDLQPLDSGIPQEPSDVQNKSWPEAVAPPASSDLAADIPSSSAESLETNTKALRALQHFEQWLRSRHPEFSDQEVQKQIEYVANWDVMLDYYVGSDVFDEQMLRSDPDWVPWYRRTPPAELE